MKLSNFAHIMWGIAYGIMTLLCTILMEVPALAFLGSVILCLFMAHVMSKISIVQRGYDIRAATIVTAATFGLGQIIRITGEAGDQTNGKALVFACFGAFATGTLLTLRRRSTQKGAETKRRVGDADLEG